MLKKDTRDTALCSSIVESVEISYRVHLKLYVSQFSTHLKHSQWNAAAVRASVIVRVRSWCASKYSLSVNNNNRQHTRDDAGDDLHMSMKVTHTSKFERVSF